MLRKLLSIHFRNVSNRRISSYHVTYGVPLARGVLRSSESLHLQLASGELRAVQAKPLEFHSDGSIKWLLLDFSLPLEANDVGNIALLDGEANISPPQLYVEENDDGVLVRTSHLSASFSRTCFALFDSFDVGGHNLIESGSDIILEDVNGKLFYASLASDLEVRVVECGSQRVVVQASGRHTAEDGKTLLDFRMRYTICDGEPGIRLSYKFANREESEQGILLRSMRIEVPCAIGNKTTKFVRQSHHAKEWLTRRVEIRENVELTAGETQSAAGQARYGAAAQGKVLIHNIESLNENFAEYPHFLRPGNPRTDMSGGVRQMYPYLGANGENGSVLGWFFEMENQYPKAVRCERNRFSFDVWPAWAGELRVRRGQSKEHDLYISLSPEPRSHEALEAEFFDHEISGLGILGGASSPLLLTLDDDYVRSCEVLQLHRWLPYDETRYFAVETKLGDPSSVGVLTCPGKGMMDYGDWINADRSWMHNNENDAILDLIREYYRRQDGSMLLAALAKARHNAHVDFIAYDPDELRQGAMPAHCPEHTDGSAYPSHMWVDGLLAAYNISGNEDFAHAALCVGENLLRWQEKKPDAFYADSRECGWPFLAFLRLHEYSRAEKWLEACEKIFCFYRDKIGPDGEIKYALPRGLGTELMGYGEFIAWRALYFYYERTGKAEVKEFLVSVLDKVYLHRPRNFVMGWAVNDLFPAWAAYDLTGDAKYIEDNYPFLQFLMQRPGNFPWGGVDMHFYLGELHRRGTLSQLVGAAS